jgi:hypothetical protein
MVGTDSRTTRVSGVTRNLKDAEAKSLPDEQESHMRQTQLDEKAHYLQSSITALNASIGFSIGF